MALNFSLDNVDGINTPVMVAENDGNTDVIINWYLRTEGGKNTPERWAEVEANSTARITLDEAIVGVDYSVWINEGGSYAPTLTISYDLVPDLAWGFPETLEIDKYYGGLDSIVLPYEYRLFELRTAAYIDFKVYGEATGTRTKTISSTQIAPGTYSGVINLSPTDVNSMMRSMGGLGTCTCEVIIRTVPYGLSTSLERVVQTMTLTTSEEKSGPTVSDFTYTLSQTDVIQGITNVTVTSATTAYPGGTRNSIVSYKVITSSGNYENSALPITASPFASQSGSQGLTLEVTDERGYKGRLTKTIDVIPWQVPEILTWSVERNNIDSTKFDVTLEGRYFPVVINNVTTNFISNIEAIVDGVLTHTLDLTDIQYNADIFTLTTTVLGSAVQDNEAYSVQLRVQDHYNGVGTSDVKTLLPLKCMVYFRQNGIGIGAEPSVNYNGGVEITDANGNFCRLPPVVASTTVSIVFGQSTTNVTAYKNSGFVSMSLNVPMNGFTGNLVIATMPAGYCPTDTVYMPVVLRTVSSFTTSDYYSAILSITTAGQVRLRSNSTAALACSNGYLSGNITFIAG